MNRSVFIGSAIAVVGFFSISVVARADVSPPEPSRADLVSAAEQTTHEVKGFEIYPRGTGPRGAVSFARFTVALPIERDDQLGKDKICLRPGFTPGDKNPSFGVILEVAF